MLSYPRMETEITPRIRARAPITTECRKRIPLIAVKIVMIIMV